MTTTPRHAASLTSRECPGCGRGIRAAYYACTTCWRRLPADHRLAVTRAWGRRQRGAPGAADEHENAKAEAKAWLDEHPAGAR